GDGFRLRDAATEQIVRAEDPRIRVIKVAGVSYRLDALRDDAFAPGKRLVLRPEPDNEHDPHAIGIWDEAGRLPAGYVPAETARWLVSEGQEVAEDDPLVEIQTDKTTVEIPSPAAGKVTSILVEEGKVVPVGTVLVVIGGDADGGRRHADADVPAPAAAPGKARATPLVRKIAQELGVDLDSLDG